MNTYAPQIERFAYGQMKKGYIDPYLEVIYGWLFQNVGVNEETAPFLSRYLFTYRITVFNDKIESVLVKHKELRKDSAVRWWDGLPMCRCIQGTAF